MSARAVVHVASACAVVGLLVSGDALAFSGVSHQPQCLGDAFMVDTGVVLIPAAGSQCSYSAASNGNGWRVMWGYGYSVYTNGISTDGSLLETWGGLVGHDSYMRGGLTRSIVGTGSGFLAVWTSRSAPSRIWASRLDSAGTLADSLPVFEGDSNQAWPAAAFDGDSTCLVVWATFRGSDRDIYAARLTASGQVLDTNPLPVAQVPSQRDMFPTVAFGQGVYLVAWTSYDSSNWATAKARRVSAAGVLLDTAIFLRRDSAMRQERPALAFGDTCFLAAWSEGMGRPDIYAARVSVSGSILDSAGMQLSSGPFRDWFPSVGFDGTSFLVMWQETDTMVMNAGTVCGRRVTADGVPLDSVPIRPAPPHSSCTYPSVAADHRNFLVAFCAYDSLTHDDNVCCRRISPDGAVLDSGIFFPLGADAQTGPSGASDGTDFLVAWTETRPQGQTVVQAARIAADGTLLDPVGFTVSDAPGAKSNVATGFGDSLYLVAWADNRSAEGADIYCARVSRDGQVLDMDGILVCDESLYQNSPDVSFDGHNFLLVWYDYRTGTDGDIYAARVSPGGVVLDPGGFPVSVDTCEDMWPKLCFADTEYLVVWGSGFSLQGPYDIYGALIARDGVITKPRFLVSGATGEQRYPAVASGPTSYLVVWVDTRLPNTKPDIFGTRVSADGTVLDTNGIAVVENSGEEQSPRVTSDGAGFRVLWSRWELGTTAIATGRVDTAGNVSHVSDWFAVTVSGPDASVGYDVAYGGGPELLLLFDFWTDTAAATYYGNRRLWARLGDVPGVEQAESWLSRRATGGASIVRGVLFLPRDMTDTSDVSDRVPRPVLLDISGRKVMSLKSGANDVRALAPGVYFLRGPKTEDRSPNATVRKVIIAR
ncbi:hypothetical protein FJY68_06030 [candidate division WOR-3 bacterium]|uniref:T9SS type A sorting domain-containing protein n=1 Tax=candidate division WOR-3 bacterium TaxID=2052148 RepID=A0A937XDY2_UNCW3|nr:hypothetical protein [candidate division WOR-3 bacterium]